MPTICETIHLSTGTMSGRKKSNKKPRPSSDEARRRMKSVRQRGTSAELSLRRNLFRRGLRYRVNAVVIDKPRRSADVVFKSLRIAVFVDGCFWHGCPRHATWPRANKAFWLDKIEANRKRDLETTALLSKAGWLVLRFWEHDDMEAASRRVATAVARRRGRSMRHSR